MKQDRFQCGQQLAAMNCAWDSSCTIEIGSQPDHTTVMLPCRLTDALTSMLRQAFRYRGPANTLPE